MAASDKLSDVHERAMRRACASALATQDQRMLSLAARRFVSIPGAQWEDQAWAEQFENSICVEINKTARGLERITNDYRANRLTVNYRAVSNDASEEAAETLEGMHRADAYHFKAQQARDNAFDEAAAGGFGAWRLLTEYANPDDPDDESLRINPASIIVDADQRVFWDLNSKLYDKSDAKWCVVVTAMARDAFEEEYPDCPASWPDDVPKVYFDWFTPDVCLVAEYYEVESVNDTRLTFTNALTGEVRREWASDLDDGEADDLLALGWTVQPRKRMKRRRVHKYLLSGSDVIEDQGLIAGDCIPVIPVYGKRWFIDNVERWRGHVQLAMDPQRVYNAQISKLTETAALPARETPIFTPEQVAGHEPSWARMNIDRLAYTLLNPVIGPDGQPNPLGPLGYTKPPEVPPVLAALVTLMGNDIAELTQANDGADQVRSNVSADAMEIAATRVDAKSATYMDNMRQSVQREGEVYKGKARDVYFEPGREVETIDGSGAEGKATLKELVTDADTGAATIRNDLTKGRYNVISDVMEATPTRRDKSVRALLNVAERAGALGDAEMGKAALTVAVLQMDGEGLGDFKDFLRRKAVASGLVKPTEAEQRQLDQSAQQQQPDPAMQVAQAQAVALLSGAEKDKALAEKALADTGLSKARTVESLAKAGEIARTPALEAMR